MIETLSLIRGNKVTAMGEYIYKDCTIPVLVNYIVECLKGKLIMIII